jgi:uncharacterized phage infection (PIP) family protein YhgE
MPVCSGNKETDAQITSTINTPFRGPSCLPNNGEGWSGNDVDPATGIISSASIMSVDTHIASLVSRLAAAPGPNVSDSTTTLSETRLNSANNFSTNSATLRTNIDNEYCYYYVRYKKSLNLLLSAAVNPQTNTTSPSYMTLKTNTENLNRKLNQIIQVLQSLVNNRLSTLNTYYGSGGVNQINSELNMVRDKLQKDAKNLNDSQMETNVKTAMMDYTIEKNNASRNMLAVYGFLNIVAVGMLYYMYRSIK